MMANCAIETLFTQKISRNENFILIYNKRGLHHITKNKRQAEIVYDLLLRMIRKFRLRA